MRKIISTGMLILCLVTNLFSQETHVKDAEDLWGNKIDFDQIIHSPKTTVIQPFSSSNCGYCLLDGHFIEKNFFENNRLKNGINFTQCLFNPQLDVYAFIKHYRDTLTPVLTYPLELHNYHQDGYPAILAFRNGEQVVKLPEGSLFPYDSSFEQIKMNLWNDTSVRFQPVSDLQFATRIIYENRNNTAICAVQDGNSTDFDKNSKFASKAKCFRVKYLSMLTADDRSKNILYTGKYSRENYRYFCGNNSPFRMEGDSVFCFGPYRLGVDSIGVSACFPNPSNPEKYVVLMIQGSKVDKHLFDNSVDYTIFSYDQKTSSTRVLLHGFFDKKPSNRWLFSDSLCLSHIKASADCVRTCTQPDRKFLPEHPVKIAGPGFRKTALGEEYTFGNSACRFPSIAADNEGKVWICWEEKGDIMMSSVERHHPVCMAVESNGSDSYNPLIVSKNEKLWIFYLNNRDGFYRVYGRSFDGRALSEPVLYSGLLPCDVVTPAVVSTKNRIVLAWTCWKSNFRFPFYREIRNGIPGEILPVAIAKSIPPTDYINAWYFSLSADTAGNPWGAWNQHYPSMLGVCAGSLSSEGVSVTSIAENMDDSEIGGYPSAIQDNTGLRWVFWESSSLGVLEGDRQKILGSVFDPVSGKWTPSFSLPTVSNTFLNQTPQAVSTPSGNIWVTWSGRTPKENWVLNLACYSNDKWSMPVSITTGKDPARAPKIIADNNQGVWVVCHYGQREKMKIKVFRISGPLP